MSIKFVTGDLFNTPGLKCICHGCNCAGAMGAGIAVQFRNQFPKMYNKYKVKCKTGQFNLGDVFMWSEDDWVVFNLGTQKTWGMKAELKAIESSVNTMVQLAAGLKIDNIGIPKIGAGLCGLEWQPIKDVLNKIGACTDIELIVFEEFTPSK